jgi:hypothetical protein
MNTEKDLQESTEQALTIPVVSSRFSSEDMIAFGNFIRDNYHGVGAPKLISYNHTKYPHGTIEDIFVIWCCENGY